VRVITGIFAITVLCIGAPKLCAQEVEQADPIESMPIRMGPLGLNPTIAITNFGIDTNVFNDPVDPKSDFTFTATPTMTARLRSGRVLVGGALSTGLVYYQQFDDERSMDYSTRSRLDLDLGWFRPFGRAERLDTRDRLSLELDVRAPRVATLIEGGARAVVSPRTGFTFAARRNTVAFDQTSVFDGVSLSDTLNSRTNVLEGGLELYLTPLTTLTMLVARQEDRFEATPERNSDSLRVMPTLRLEAPAIVQGSLAVGYRRFDGLDSSLPDFAGLVFQGSLSHVLAERTKVGVTIARDVEYSFELLEPYFLTTGARVTLNHQLRDTIDLRAAAARDELHYQVHPTELAPAGDRRDRVESVSAGFGYLLRTNVRVGLDVEYSRRSSSRLDRRYDRTRLLGSASYGF
jgi:hypothetical protein